MSVQLVATRQSDDGPALAPSEEAHAAVSALEPGAGYEEELDAIVVDLQNIIWDLPDEVMRLCQGYMARCTEMHLNLVRMGSNRAAKFVRTQQLAKVMELIDFTYKAASRSVEIRRQDVEMSK
jgi:hypothetical protein